MPNVRGCFIVCAAAMLCGCAAIKVQTFRESKLSGVEPGRLAVALAPSKMDGPLWRELPKLDTPGFADVWEKNCAAPRPAPEPGSATTYAAPFLLPIIGALVQVGVDLLFAKLEADADALRARANVDYGTRLVLEKVKWEEVKCLLLVRFGAKDPHPPELIFVAKFNWYPQASGASRTAFTLQPIYVLANTSVAVATETDPTMSLIVAMGIKGVHAPRNGVPTVAAIGVASNAVRSLRIGASMPACASSDCEPSDLVALPLGLSVISLGVQVAEVGEIGFDIDLAKRQLEAMKNALGPALAEAVTIRLTPPPPSSQ